MKTVQLETAGTSVTCTKKCCHKLKRMVLEVFFVPSFSKRKSRLKASVARQNRRGVAFAIFEINGKLAIRFKCETR
jgi:hypothetical protein